jgi:peptide/nickel transport system substrate-binding protein
MNSIRFGEAPLLRKVSLTFKTFSFTEKIIFSVIFLVALVSAIIILAKLNEQYLVKVPHRGGSLTEGIVGSPRFINPVLALSDTDKDAASLIYSGLMKATPEGSLINDLAQEVNISEDLLEYSITLKEGLSFHDGAPLTADDVIFTIKTAQNSLHRSPLKVNWDGITVERVSENQVKFILKQPYSPFIENLTLGILPKHIWENLDEEQFQASLFNTEPIGSGPYEISKLKRNSGGLPIYYELSPFKEYALGRAVYRFFNLKVLHK